MCHIEFGRITITLMFTYMSFVARTDTYSYRTVNVNINLQFNSLQGPKDRVLEIVHSTVSYMTQEPDNMKEVPVGIGKLCYMSIGRSLDGGPYNLWPVTGMIKGDMQFVF